MKHPQKLVLLAAAMVIPAAISSTAAVAQPDDYRWQGDRDSNWDPARHYDEHGRRYIDERERVYRGSDGRYYCKRPDGSTGLVLGAVGGAVIGNALGGGLLGTVLGGVGGGLVGKHINKEHDEEQNARHGYVCD